MSLVSGVSALATRIATEFRAIRTALAAKADDSAVVHNTGTETVGGAKTFSVAPSVPVGNLLAHPVRRDDARLTDARTPTAHASTHAPGQPDALSGYVPATRAVSAGTGLSGGGDLSSDRSLAVVYGTAAATATIGNDARVVGAEQVARKGVASGYPSLDTSTKIPIAQLPTGTGSNLVALGDDSRFTNARTPLGHAASHAPGQSDALTGYVPSSLVGAVSGVASLDSGGKVPAAQIPAIALTDYLGSVASQAAMLALTGQRGDWAFRSDTGTDWQLVAEPSTSLASWQERHYPASPVSSVNGRIGAVTGLAEAAALAGYVPTTRQVIAGGGLTGGGALSGDVTLAASYGATTPGAVAAAGAVGSAATLSRSDHVHPGVPSTRQVSAGTGLSGGGDLSSDRALAVVYGTGAGTALQGNDPAVTNARTPVAHAHSGGDVTSGTVGYARLPVGAAASTVAAGDDARLSDARAWALYTAGGEATGRAPVWNGSAYVPGVPARTVPRAASGAASVSIDGSVDGDVDLTCTGDTVITPTGSLNGRVLVITCLASGAQRAPSIAAAVPTAPDAVRTLTIPSGARGRFILRYTALGTAGWTVESSYLTG